jgi:hypothetical protein
MKVADAGEKIRSEPLLPVLLVTVRASEALP